MNESRQGHLFRDNDAHWWLDDQLLSGSDVPVGGTASELAQMIELAYQAGVKDGPLLMAAGALRQPAKA